MYSVGTLSDKKIITWLRKSISFIKKKRTWLIKKIKPLWDR